MRNSWDADDIVSRKARVEAILQGVGYSLIHFRRSLLSRIFIVKKTGIDRVETHTQWEWIGMSWQVIPEPQKANKPWSPSLTQCHPPPLSILPPPPSTPQTKGVTRDHKWITREAIRRNIRRFFLDYPPLTQPEFNVPTDASLTELYRAYYGASSSPVRFIKAVNSVAASNVKADSVRQLRWILCGR